MSIDQGYDEIDNVHGSRNKNSYLTYHFNTTLAIKNCGILLSYSSCYLRGRETYTTSSNNRLFECLTKHS